MNSNIGIYTKAFAALVVTGLTGYATAVQDGGVTAAEWITIAIAVTAGTAIVWAVPQTPRVVQTYGKALAAGLVAGLTSIAAGLVDGAGLSSAEITTAVVAFIIGSGLVGVSSNAASSDPVDAETKKIIPVSLAVKREAIKASRRAV